MYFQDAFISVIPLCSSPNPGQTATTSTARMRKLKLKPLPKQGQRAGWAGLPFPDPSKVFFFFLKHVARHSSSHGCAHRHTRAQACTPVHRQPLSTLRPHAPVCVHMASQIRDLGRALMELSLPAPHKAFDPLPLLHLWCVSATLGSRNGLCHSNHPELQWVSRRDLGENPFQVWVLGSLAQVGQKKSPGGFPKRERMSPSEPG